MHPLNYSLPSIYIEIDVDIIFLQPNPFNWAILIDNTKKWNEFGQAKALCDHLRACLAQYQPDILVSFYRYLYVLLFLKIMMWYRLCVWLGICMCSNKIQIFYLLVWCLNNRRKIYFKIFWPKTLVTTILYPKTSCTNYKLNKKKKGSQYANL